MKFALNGALTIGTLDGANVEMLDHVGADNIFIFGNTAEEVEELRRQGYKPREYYEKDEELHQVLTQIGSGVFSPEDPGRYRDLVDSLINFGDHYQVLADYRSYVDCQDKVDELYELQEEWTAKAMLNIANMGYFSSDRTIKEYADLIWHIDPVRLNFAKNACQKARFFSPLFRKSVQRGRGYWRSIISPFRKNGQNDAKQKMDFDLAGNDFFSVFPYWRNFWQRLLPCWVPGLPLFLSFAIYFSHQQFTFY